MFCTRRAVIATIRTIGIVVFFSEMVEISATTPTMGRDEVS